MSSTRALDVVLSDLGKKVRAARNALGLTQEDAADLAAIDYKRYQRIEAGQVNVTIKTLMRIAFALNTTFSDLVALPLKRRRRSSR